MTEPTDNPSENLARFSRLSMSTMLGIVLVLGATTLAMTLWEAVDAQLSFQRAADGSVSTVVLHQNGRDLKGARQSE